MFWGVEDDCDCPEFGGKIHECEMRPDGVQYDRLVPHLISIMKDQQERIEALESSLGT